MRGRTLVVRLMLETNVRNTSDTTGNKTYHDIDSARNSRGRIFITVVNLCALVCVVGLYMFKTRRSRTSLYLTLSSVAQY